MQAVEGLILVHQAASSARGDSLSLIEGTGGCQKSASHKGVNLGAPVGQISTGKAHGWPVPLSWSRPRSDGVKASVCFLGDWDGTFLNLRRAKGPNPNHYGYGVWHERDDSPQKSKSRSDVRKPCCDQ